VDTFFFTATHMPPGAPITSCSSYRMEVEEVSAILYSCSRLRRKKKRFWIYPTLPGNNKFEV
jgi:hypothetical protein